MARLTKANRALLEQNLRELNRELAQARVDHDEESIAILEAQVKSTIDKHIGAESSQSRKLSRFL